MTKDHSRIFQLAEIAGTNKREQSLLEKLGWQSFLAQQISVDALTDTPPVRVVEVHRNGLHVIGDGIDTLIPPGPAATVGDWLLLNSNHPPSSQVLHRKSLFQRRAPGTGRQAQLIAANVDTAFVVTSCNLDFNIARLERYIALAFDAEATPVIVLTKTDLCPDISQFVEAATAISDRVAVVPLNAKSGEPIDKIAAWCKPGQTVAFLGSSGVGKSTLVNALYGEEKIDTAGIREDDSKGRHTTTSRQLHLTPQGCAVLDTPGMRELQLADAESGIEDVFADLTELASECRFRNCKHETEPGCAILKGLETRTIDQSRVERWRKLAAEERHNSATLAERRAKDKSFGKLARTILKEKNNTRQ